MGLIFIPGPDPEPDPEPRFQAIDPTEIDRWVSDAIARNRRVRRNHESQELLDRLVERLHADGELYFAAAVLMLCSMRVAGAIDPTLQVLLQLAIDLRVAGAMDQQCRLCHCTDAHPCEGGCHWVEFDLCSKCDELLRAGTRRAMDRPPGRDA